jgi:hypothetical protein
MRCAMCGPLFRELEDPPGIPAGTPPKVYRTRRAPPRLRRKRPRSAAAAALAEELQRLLAQVACIEQRLGLERIQ